MSELKVRSERQSLSHGDITPSLEHHHRDGSSGETITNDELGNDVESNLLIRNSLNHANRNEVHEGYNKNRYQHRTVMPYS